MDRYFEEHGHRPDVCPAGNPEMAVMLAGHLSPENGERHGVSGFFTPFTQVGSVSIKPVITCQIVTAKAQD